MNPFAPLYAQQNTGTAEEKHANLPGFPRLIDIEPVGLCNFRCVCCPTGLQAVTRPQGFMDEGVFYDIVSQCAPHETALRFIGWGEPTLHPQIVSFVRTASDAGVLTHINTNGSKITWDLAVDLVDAGLSSIKFSFQGVDRETYQETRKIDFFDGMIEAIRIMRGARGELPMPFIAASTSTTYETPEQIESFRHMMEPLVDHLSIGKTIFGFIDSKAIRINKADFERLSKLAATDLKHPDPCPEVFDKLSMSWDGTGRVCCNDHSGVTNLGNIKDTSIEQMWNAPTMQKYRKRLAEHQYVMQLCQTCYQYQEH